LVKNIIESTPTKTPEWVVKASKESPHQFVDYMECNKHLFTFEYSKEIEEMVSDEKKERYRYLTGRMDDSPRRKEFEQLFKRELQQGLSLEAFRIWQYRFDTVWEKYQTPEERAITRQWFTTKVNLLKTLRDAIKHSKLSDDERSKRDREWYPLIKTADEGAVTPSTEPKESKDFDCRQDFKAPNLGDQEPRSPPERWYDPPADTMSVDHFVASFPAHCHVMQEVQVETVVSDDEDSVCSMDMVLMKLMNLLMKFLPTRKLQ
jgi:hypothetical protein